MALPGLVVLLAPGQVFDRPDWTNETAEQLFVE